MIWRGLLIAFCSRPIKPVGYSRWIHSHEESVVYTSLNKDINGTYVWVSNPVSKLGILVTGIPESELDDNAHN